MITWRWIGRTVLPAIHEMQLAGHGGGAGLCDGNLLETALAKPENLTAYGEPDTAALAATYGYGTSRNHAFIDGDKLTALLAAELFLQFNGWRLVVGDAHCVLTMLAVTTGDIAEDAFTDLLRRHSHKKSQRGL